MGQFSKQTFKRSGPSDIDKASISHFGNGGINAKGEPWHGTNIIFPSIFIQNYCHLTLSSSSPENSTAGTAAYYDAAPSEIDKAAISHFGNGGTHRKGKPRYSTAILFS